MAVVVGGYGVDGPVDVGFGEGVEVGVGAFVVGVGAVDVGPVVVGVLAVGVDVGVAGVGVAVDGVGAGVDGVGAGVDGVGVCVGGTGGVVTLGTGPVPPGGSSRAHEALSRTPVTGTPVARCQSNSRARVPDPNTPSAGCPS